MRLVGYDRAPARLPRGSGAPAPSPEALADRARDALAALGPRTRSSAGASSRAAWLARGWAAPRWPTASRSRTRSRPTTRSCARRCCRASVDAPAATSRAACPTSALFEVGPVVRRAADPKEPPIEPTHGGGDPGRAARAGWLKPGEPVDFYDAQAGRRRAAARASASRRRASCRRRAQRPACFTRASRPRSATGGDDGRLVGRAGRDPPARSRARSGSTRAPSISRSRSTRSPASGAPVAQRAAAALPGRRRATSRSGSTPASPPTQQRALLASAAEPLLRDLAVLEDFRDPRTRPPGKKGMLWTMTYRADDRTLTDAEVDAAHARVVAALKAAPSVVPSTERPPRRRRLSR